MSEYKTLQATYVGERKTFPKGAHGMVGVWNNWWMMGCPRCGQVVRLGDHDVNVDNTGLVTISPSVGHTSCKAHFFVKSGKIQVVSDL